jgi:hypothetical protein
MKTGSVKCHGMVIFGRLRAWAGVALMLALAPASGQTFSNSTPISLAVGQPTTPYPSTIAVPSLTGVVAAISVSLHGVTYGFPDDLDVLLVGPGGQKVMLMSDAGGGNGVAGATLKFSQSASALLPNSTQITAGTYRPTDYEPGDVFPSGAATGPYGTDLDLLVGTDPAAGAAR